MGTVPHHQARAADFLRRATRAIADHDPTEAATALARAASHAATATAVHYGFRHNSRRRLEFGLQSAVANGFLSRSHVNTFRQSCPLSPHRRRKSPSPTAGRKAPSPLVGEGRGEGYPPITLRRLRRRVAAMLADVAAFLAGKPKPVHYHKLWLRKPDRPILPELYAASDILNLPNYAEIRSRFDLFRAPLMAEPDPHGCYDQGYAPLPCSCHQRLWDRAKTKYPTKITLSPLWRRALEKTFRVKLPDQLQLTC